MPYLQFAFVCAVWSISFLLMKKAAVVFSPADIALGRVVGGAAILALVWAWKERRWGLRRQDGAPLAVVVVAGCAWPYFIQPWVIRQQGSAFMALMVSFVPLLTIGCSLVLLRVRPSARQSLGVLGALVCLAVLMGDGLKREVPWSHFGLAISVPAGYAIANTVIRGWLSHVSALLLTCVSFALTAVVMLPFAALGERPEAAANVPYGAAWGSLAFLAIVGTGIATFVFNHLVRQHGPLFAGMTTNVVPLGAIFWGWFDHEPISAAQIGAMTGILLMVSLVQFRAAQRVRPEPPEKP